MWRDLRPSRRTQDRLSRAMQFILVGLFAHAIITQDVNGMIGSGVAIWVTFLPAILERDYKVPMDVRLTLWITSAVFLHQAGAQLGIYRAVWWWDKLTHTISASIVAAAGYATVRAVDEHSDDVNFPPRFVFVFVLLSVLAAGVVWEVMEYTLFQGMSVLGLEPILAQHGIADTIMDLMFDAVGAVLVAVWGTVYLGDVTGALTELLDRRAGEV